MSAPSLAGRRVLVTGGSRGIGAAIALELASQGVRLTLLARDEAGLTAVGDEIVRRGHLRPFCMFCDVTEPESVASSVRHAVETMGGLDGVVNNAGINHPMRPFLAVTTTEFREVLEVNFFGAVEIVRATLPHLVAQGSGSIVNIASMAGKMGVPNWSAYCSSKHALLGFTKVIAREVALAGVTCNAICPGFVDTNMVSKEKLEAWAEELGTTRRELVKEVVLKQTPQHRYVSRESVAEMTAYLLSTRGTDITGQAINISCGVGDY